MMFFFFQAEDGIRDGHVTGVQTCALPIFLEVHAPRSGSPRSSRCAWTSRRRDRRSGAGSSCAAISPSPRCTASSRSASTGSTITCTASRSARSEEHTSELQSRGHLVCRLLLEKKKKQKRTTDLEH